MADEVQVQEAQQTEAAQEEAEELVDTNGPEAPAEQAAEAVPIEKTAEGEVLPFPRARVVSIMRSEIKDKIIRSEVKEAMNFWLGNLLKKLAREMNNSIYGSVSIADFNRATKPYDMIEDIVKDRERIMVSTEKLKQDSDSIKRELARFFETITGKSDENNSNGL